jgi:hypothetical protein
MGPSADAGKEVALRETGKVIGQNILYGSTVDNTGRNKLCVNQRLKPCRRERVVLVVIGGHGGLISFGTSLSSILKARQERNANRANSGSYTLDSL